VLLVLQNAKHAHQQIHLYATHAKLTMQFLMPMVLDADVMRAHIKCRNQSNNYPATHVTKTA
jgi:hypothetical protein